MPYFFLYLFTSSRISRVHHPALESLRTHIPAVLAHSKAHSTFKTYHGCFKRWKSWASGFPEVIYFPAQEKHVALNLISLVQSGSSYSSIQQAFYSISFFHNACGVSNPCKSAFLLAIGDAQCASQRAMRGMRAMRGRHARHAENARHVARHCQHVRHELSRSQFFFSSLLLGSYAWSTPF